MLHNWKENSFTLITLCNCVDLFCSFINYQRQFEFEYYTTLKVLILLQALASTLFILFLDFSSPLFPFSYHNMMSFLSSWRYLSFFDVDIFLYRMASFLLFFGSFSRENRRCIWWYIYACLCCVCVLLSEINVNGLYAGTSLIDTHLYNFLIYLSL